MGLRARHVASPAITGGVGTTSAPRLRLRDGAAAADKRQCSGVSAVRCAYYTHPRSRGSGERFVSLVCSEARMCLGGLEVEDIDSTRSAERTFVTSERAGCGRICLLWAVRSIQRTVVPDVVSTTTRCKPPQTQARAGESRRHSQVERDREGALRACLIQCAYMLCRRKHMCACVRAAAGRLMAPALPFTVGGSTVEVLTGTEGAMAN